MVERGPSFGSKGLKALALLSCDFNVIPGTRQDGRLLGALEDVKRFGLKHTGATQICEGDEPKQIVGQVAVGKNISHDIQVRYAALLVL